MTEDRMSGAPKDVQRQLNAIATLALRGKAGDRDALSLLIPMLDGLVSEEASDALSWIGEASVVPLADRLLDRRQTSGMRMAAATTLRSIGDARGVEALIEVCQDSADNLSVRRLAALYLGQSPSACQALVPIALDASEDPELRLTAVEGIGESGDASSRLGLSPILDADDVRVIRARWRVEIAKVDEMMRIATGPLVAELGEIKRRAAEGVSLHAAVRRAMRGLGQSVP